MAAADLVDIVDEHDNVVRTVTRAEMRAANLRHRAVGIAVLSSERRPSTLDCREHPDPVAPRREHVESR